VEEAAVAAARSLSPPEPHLPLLSAGRMGSACAAPFLGRAGGAVEMGGPNESSVGEGLGKLQCDFEPHFGIWCFRWTQPKDPNGLNA
jgi:hypothetical protein